MHTLYNLAQTKTEILNEYCSSLKICLRFFWRLKCTDVPSSANHGIVATFNLVLLHVPTILVARAAAVATAEVALSGVNKHVPDQVALELGHLAAHLAPVLLLAQAASQGQQHLLHVLSVAGTERPGGFPNRRWDRWGRRKAGGAQTLDHLRRENVKDGRS